MPSMEQDTGRSHVRPPAVAGIFYPPQPQALEELVDSLLRDAAATPDSGVRPRAIIAPHAGYPYSGPVAASVYARLRDAEPGVRRVLLLGPAHRVSVIGLAGSSASSFATPLGETPVDQWMLSRLTQSPDVFIHDQAHEGEHSLETQLPFLQSVLAPGFRVTPLLVGAASPRLIASVIRRFWQIAGEAREAGADPSVGASDDTLVVVSSDLSHYLDHASATRRDRATAEAILEKDPARLSPHDACGAPIIQGLLSLAPSASLEPELVDLRNSGDTAGPRDQVVGYGAFVFR